jgi:hypothetical protein
MGRKSPTKGREKQMIVMLIQTTSTNMTISMEIKRVWRVRWMTPTALMDTFLFPLS